MTAMLWSRINVALRKGHVACVALKKWLSKLHGYVIVKEKKAIKT